MFFKRLIAFTMAEVLVVLGILGVTAAITLPNLNDDIEERKVVSKLRKIYAEFQAINETIVQTYGSPTDWNVASTTTAANMTTRYGDYFKELAGVKIDCGVAIDSRCFNTAKWPGNGSFRKFLMKDGSSVAILINAKSSLALSEGIWGEVGIDVNGPSGENQPGYDIFRFPLCAKRGLATACVNNLLPDDEFGQYAGEWVIKAGNRDYLKCEDDLNWRTKRTCN